jgi:hypothetical protein
MNIKQMIGIAAIALAPFAANADQGDKYLEQLVGTPKSTLTRAEVLAQAGTYHFGQRHPVDLQINEKSTLTRAEFLRELMAGAVERGGA